MCWGKRKKKKKLSPLLNREDKKIKHCVGVFVKG